MFPRLRLHYRIVIPFVLIAIAIPAGAAFVALRLIVRSLEARVATQVENAAAVVSRSDFALNSSVLLRLRDITGAHVITYTADGAVQASTLGDRPAPGLLATVMAAEATRNALSGPEGKTLLRQATCDGIPCRLAYRRVVSRPDLIVALIFDTTELNAAETAITRSVLLSMGLSVLVMALVSQAVARRVTGPLERLMEFTRRASPGASGQRAEGGQDEIGRLAAAFNDMLDRLDRAQDALVRSEKLAVTGLLAAGVAHDIRNPLASIKMQSQLLLQSGMSAERAQPVLEDILRDIGQVESVVSDLLELARPGDLKVQAARLPDVVNDALRQMKPQLTHRKIAVVADLPANLPAVQLDTARFKQAILNVCVNAADAMPYGGTLEVIARSLDDGSALVLQICDDGVGVDPALADRVFDPFVTTKNDGIGLGLVNARSVVEGHGGRIALAPRQPKGTMVTIQVPVGGAPPASRQGPSHG